MRQCPAGVVSEGGTKIVEKVYNCPDNVLQDKNVRAKALCVKRQTPILLMYDGLQLKKIELKFIDDAVKSKIINESEN